MTTPDDDPAATAVWEYLTGRTTTDHPAVAAFLADSRLDDRLRALGRGGLREPDLNTDERFVGDYELLEKVGGNMGTVYRARQRSLPREAAVKLLLRGESYRDRFRTEAEAMARLQHPHVVRIWEVSRADGVPYLGMEWCPGGTLAEKVGEFRSQPDRAAAIVETVARAVHHAHRRGILHRDLKPANILFDELGQPRVADLGLAVPVGGSDGAPAGTPAYMAPEQLDGEVTVATDVFGLGAILYELLTGRPPSAGDTLTAVFDRVRAGDRAPPATLNPAVDPDLDAVCRKCLATDPAARYGSAEALADDLERYRLGRPTVARPLGIAGRVTHLLRHARVAADFRSLAPGLVGLAAFVLVSNAAVYGLLRAGAAEPWVWLALFASYGPLFVTLGREWWTGRTHNPARRHLWSVWVGHALACAGVFAGLRVATGDLGVAVGYGYVGSAGVCALAFTVMGSLFAGRQYL